MNTVEQSFAIREIKFSDSTAVRALTAQLGYPLSEKEIERNISVVIESKSHTAFVAEHNEKVIGWIGVSQAIMIEFNPFCEINGLVIEENYRGQGVGKLLIEQAKRWARERGNATLRVRCNVKRKHAHEFYQRLGFIETKEQKNFEMKL